MRRKPEWMRNEEQLLRRPKAAAAISRYSKEHLRKWRKLLGPAAERWRDLCRRPHRHLGKGRRR